MSTNTNYSPVHRKLGGGGSIRSQNRHSTVLSLSTHQGSTPMNTSTKTLSGIRYPISGFPALWRSKTTAFLAFVALTLFAGSLSAVPLTGTKNIPGDYADLATAITDLNTQGVG